MYTFKPSKKTAVFVCLIVLAAAAALTVYFRIDLRNISLPLISLTWTVALLLLYIFVYGYNKHTRVTFSNDEITKYTFFFYYKYQCMSMKSVTSVTTFITPFGGVTGLNMIIVNALGARMFLFFMEKDDCNKAASFLESVISSRNKDN